ncbi:MAG TPA: mandelate racemase [Dehalococcoidia bacterium]|jgi:L-alanine-DL-glutamate epimerase-like enolase superfamily enzyme|nr:MAG: mandelate racemase [Dehalococcoidia bacterium]HBJ32461.1 mandelate racemase [Dehalococcoidia bacterium]HHZ61648.1 mandelate racemase [Dehalococcoidia bacterium]HIA15193.1 mandelate racemase [Dehalococcoidia bacterium]HIM17867.1 mandelate racemase [Dehalococcoidia bacterium]|tara:strand:- start:177 stop:1280 length:1104 start_codon:yes stop_codon:yes gene_type:complete
MKITNVKVDMFNWKTEAWKTGVGTTFGDTRQLGIVTVETDEGVSGNAFLGSSRMGADHFVKGMMEFIKPIVMGRNPQDIGAIWWEMWKMNRSVSTYIIGAIDICLWDINGKIAGQPIHRLLGTCKESVPVYGSTAYHETTEEYAEEAIRFKEMGWQAHKIHPHGDPQMDIKISQAVREAVGPDMKLMLDSMWAYKYADALRVGRAIEELDFYWYEDPLVEEDIYNYVKLNQKLDIPIMSTEYAPGHFYGMTPWITQYATAILRSDVAVTGGITPLVRLCHMAEGFNMMCEIHHGGNSLNNVANLHVTMAVPNCEFYEFFPCTGANVYGLVTDIEFDENGMVHAPTEPGLGYEIDWDLVKREHTATVE